MIDKDFIEILDPRSYKSLMKLAVKDVTALYAARNTPYGIAIKFNNEEYLIFGSRSTPLLVKFFTEIKRGVQLEIQDKL
jgi:hypothetical protein